MCRFAYVQDENPFAIDELLEAFAQRCRSSHEFQGDGWGISWWTPYGWHLHREIVPIWESKRTNIPRSTRFLIHARSAFEQHDIILPNNMPFASSQQAFAFNGELRGVRLRVPGRSGAARIFHLLRSDHPESGIQRVRRVANLIEQRSRVLRANNFVWARADETLICNQYRQDHEYFTLHYGSTKSRFGVASEPFDASLNKIMSNDQLLRIDKQGISHLIPLKTEVTSCA